LLGDRDSPNCCFVDQEGAVDALLLEDVWWHRARPWNPHPTTPGDRARSAHTLHLATPHKHVLGDTYNNIGKPNSDTSWTILNVLGRSLLSAWKYFSGTSQALKLGGKVLTNVNWWK
jgi:hypothetical protein